MSHATPRFAADLAAIEELRHLRALGAMAGLEYLLESLPPHATLAPEHVLALATVVHDSVREVLLWHPREAANDNP